MKLVIIPVKTLSMPNPAPLSIEPVERMLFNSFSIMTKSAPEFSSQ